MKCDRYHLRFRCLHGVHAARERCRPACAEVSCSPSPSASELAARFREFSSPIAASVIIFLCPEVGRAGQTTANVEC
jgi:hypothetical protein